MTGGGDVRFFQALGDATRLELLTRLRGGERTVGELVEALRCPQPKVSRHLKVLKEAGLVTDRRDGRHVTYALTGRRTWDPAAREWLALLDAGFPPEGRPEPGRVPRPGTGREPHRAAARERRPAARVPGAAPAAPPPASFAAPPAARPRPPEPGPEAKPPAPVTRRRDMETHLL